MSVGNCIYCSLWNVFLYQTVHIAMCGLLFVTEIYTLLCVVCLSVLNEQIVAEWSFGRYRTAHIAV